jgi:hypothetical protein
MPNLPAIQARFDTLAAAVLEDLIEDVEGKNPVKVTDLKVVLVPDGTSDAESPRVEVNLTIEAIKQ